MWRSNKPSGALICSYPQYSIFAYLNEGPSPNLSLTDQAELVLNQAYRIAGNFTGAKNASRLFTVCIFME